MQSRKGPVKLRTPRKRAYVPRVWFQRPITPVRERLEAKIERTSEGCWRWLGSLNRRGYGLIRDEAEPGVRFGKTRLAHRVSYEVYRGPITEGLELDHLCRNRWCVNPEHLEPVTPQVNQHRGEGFAGKNVRKTHCPKGHPYDEANTIRDKHGHRRCRLCLNERRSRQNPPSPPEKGA